MLPAVRQARRGHRLPPTTWRARGSLGPRNTVLASLSQKQPMSTEGTDNDSPNQFPGGADNFGLTPRTKVKSQRVDPLLGLDLGGVKIVRLIGEGGMGRVYEAQQERPSRTVAVKVIRQGITSEKTMRRFEREAEFLGKLQHPGIAQIFIVGTYSSDFGDVPFYVMEFIPNAKPITNYVHEQGLALEDKLRLFKQVCEAVSHGHDRGIVHRDLKPGNILVDGHGNAKVIDFGVARSTDSDLALTSMKTDTGQLIGIVQYMAPEQFGPDPDDLDGRTDVYSLGVVLYELVSGAVPYSVRKKALHEASRVVCEQVPPTLRSLDKAIPREVSAIAERCLQKDRRRRYHSAGELAADLGRFLDGKPVRARSGGGLLDRISLPRELRIPMPRRTGMILIFSAVAVLGMGQIFSRLIRDFEWSATSQAHVKVSPAWVGSGLKVREGDFYRLRVTGTCTDGSGNKFGPEGTAPAGVRPLLGPIVLLDDKRAQEVLVDNLPRQMVLAKVRESRFSLPVGPELAFVSPYTGELLFKINEKTSDETPSASISSGELAVTLEHVRRPELVDRNGKTEITASVNGTAYLLFKPDGLQWEYSSFLDTTGPEYPTLINGFAWWPLPEKTRTQDWLTLTQTNRTPVLKTTAFAWAARPGAPKPTVTNAEANSASGLVTAEVPKPEEPTPEQPALRFKNPAGGKIGCIVSKPKGASTR